MTELELKLVWTSEPPDLEAFFGPPDDTLNLTNQYFDTASGQLAAASYGLRLRRSGDQIEQTLKGPAPDQSGIRVRQEWNWPRDDFSIDLTRLPMGVLPLDSSAPALVETSFNTVRRRVWQRDGIEIVMDQGQVRVGQQVSPIAEIELEDKGSGWLALLKQAQRLAGTFDCFVGSISKAERGRVLAGDGFADNGSAIDALGRALDPLSGPDWEAARDAAENINETIAAAVRQRDSNVGAACLEYLCREHLRDLP